MGILCLIGNWFEMIHGIPNQKLSWELSMILVGTPTMSLQIIVGQAHLLSWAHGWHMSALLRDTSHNAAHDI